MTNNLIAYRKKSAPFIIIHLSLVLFGLWALIDTIDNYDRSNKNELYQELNLLLFITSCGSIITYYYGLCRSIYIFYQNTKNTYFVLDIVYFLLNILSIVGYIWSIDIFLRIDYSTFKTSYSIIKGMIILYSIVYLLFFYYLCYSLCLKYKCKKKYNNGDQKEKIIEIV
tara:strand:+ start:421 stop:927 length:507 start_codon:yes stop_codon:yes gene_type:complete